MSDLTDQDLDGLDMAASIGDFGSCGDEIQALTEEVRRLRALVTKLAPADMTAATWLKLSDAERMRMIGLCCRHCGATSRQCWCGPEFDE